ncbi:sodium:proton exchanger [Sphingomonas flavescens]|uniref:sodium:proton exchanger n=1 Tax=Sphingomonas flavescens TaxID=3132797 RepID=UPI002806107A|nr:sodium:proton exchanger [Sphingomonas limnosediminicola]
MRRFLVYLSIAIFAALPAIWFRLSGQALAPIAGAIVFGTAILAAGFMLSWGAEAAEERVSQGLMIAGLALVTVLPEYAVDIYLAFRAGQMPGSDYAHYAAANMTGANRLLVGFGWSLVVILHWAYSRSRSVPLRESNKVELFFLAAATAYGFVIVWKDSIGLIDFVVLLAIFGGYIWRVASDAAAASGDADNDDDDEDEFEPGPAAALETLSTRAQWIWTAVLSIMAGAIIVVSAEPFAESILGSASQLGVDRFLLIQWVAPLTGETPELILAVLFVLASKPGTALIALISDKINQWTLLVGALPIAMSLGAGRLMSLPLSARQHEEFFLTAAQSAFALSLLLQRRLTLLGAALLAGLFTLQVLLAFLLQGNSSREIATLTTLAWIYIAFALIVVISAGLQRRAPNLEIG